MIKKSIWLSIICGSLLTLLMLYESLQLQELETFMGVLTDFGSLHAMVESTPSTPPAATGFLTAEQRANRITMLQQRMDSPSLTSQEGQEIIIDLMLTRAADLLQGMANIVGDKIAEKDKNAGEGFKRLPGALAETAYMLYLTSKIVLRKSYVDDVKTLLRSTRCFKKSARSKPECADYNTTVKMISGTTKNLSKVVRPLLDALLLGKSVRDFIANEDRIIRGVVPVALDVVAHGTDLQKDFAVVVDLMRMLFDMSDKLAERYPA